MNVMFYNKILLDSNKYNECEIYSIQFNGNWNIYQWMVIEEKKPDQFVFVFVANFAFFVISF